MQARRLFFLLALVIPAASNAKLLSFAAREDFPTAPSPRLVVPADINEDEYTDLVVADDDGVSVLFGTPVGRLSAPLTVPTEIRTALLAAADFDGDGDGDLVYADRYSNDVVLRRGDGSGGFAAWRKIDVGGRPVLLSTADVDGDQRPDILTATVEGWIVLLNQGEGGFERKTTALAESPTAAALGDLNGDGRIDAVLMHSERRTLVLLENLGNGRFAPGRRIELSAPPGDAVVIDGSDGRADIAVFDITGVSLFRQLTGGEFADPSQLYPSSAVRALVTGRFTGDDRPDLAVLDSERGIALILGGEGEGRFRPAGAYDIGEGGPAVAALDLGRHQVPALAIVNRRDSCITLLRARHGGGLVGAPVYGAGEGPVSGLTRDINGDRHLDLVIADERAGAVLVFLGTGKGRFNQYPPIPTGRGTKAVAIADFDSDGKSDIAAVNSGKNDVAILAGTGQGTFASPLLFNTGTNPVDLAPLDADGDGNVDLAIANKDSRSLSILPGDGEGRLLEPRNYALPRTPDFVLAGDLNGDGHTDLIVGQRDSEEVSILKGSSSGLEDPHDSDKGERIRPSIAHDFDGDGKIDLAIVDSANDRVGVLLGSGDNLFADPIYFPVSHRPTALIAGDFNEDRRPDLVVISNSARTILLLENTSTEGDGEEENEVVVPTSPNPTPGAAAKSPEKPGDPWRGKLRDW